MAVIGTFGSFTTARLGIYASQASLQVTGNNIANINTKGYTRQRADLWSLNSTGLAHYANPMGVDIGYGVLVKSTTQVRDPYLDIRFRNQNTQLGSVNATLAGLNKIAQTLDEVHKGGETQNGIIENSLQNFLTMLEDLSDTVGSEEKDVLVREAAKSLVTFFNTAAKDLQEDWDLQADELRDTVKDVNKCLTNIRDLNEQIRKQGIYGDLALELRDARNLYIDELSSYMGINVEYSLERIDQYTSVEKLTITLKDTVDPRTDPPQPIKLIDGLYGAQLSFSEVEVNPKYNPNEQKTLKTNNDPTIAYDDGTGTMVPYKYVRVDGTGTNDPAEAAEVKLNPEYDPRAKVEAGTKLILNPAYDENAKVREVTVDGKTVKVLENTDAATAATLPYLGKDGKPTDKPEEAALAPLKYMKKGGGTTDQATEAKEQPGQYLDKNGEPTDKIEDAALASAKYLTANGEETNDINQAGPVDPNKFLFQVERLEDKFGVPLNRGRSSESVVVPLNDNDLVGSLQAMRELLTEEGEFASKMDVGLDGNSAVLDPDDPANYSALRAADANANIKKGIPYYQKRLDLLAQKFAEIFNEANQLPVSEVYVTSTDGKDTDAFSGDDKATFLDATDNPIEKPDGSGDPITVGDVTVVVNGERVEIQDTKAVREALADKVKDEIRDEIEDKVKNEMGLTDQDEIDAEVDKRIAAEVDIDKRIAAEVDKKIADSAKCLETLRDQGVLKDVYKYYDGGVLFSNSGNNNDPSNITAGNISISNGWASRVVRVLNRTEPYERDNAGRVIEHTSDNSNILHMISLIGKQLNYSASELEPDASGGDKIFFHGSFQEMYTDLGATLGSERNTITGIAANYELMTLDLDNDRISVSGVDLNDEATSMMQFQKSYQAACRLLTTIDSMLDTLINNTLR